MEKEIEPGVEAEPEAAPEPEQPAAAAIEQPEKAAEQPEPKPVAQPVQAAAVRERSDERRGPRDRDGGDDGQRRRGPGRGRRRACVMCVEKMTAVDYKDFSFLRRFLSDRGRIESRRKTGTCAKHQRALAQAIKRARHLALLPYTAEHIRAGVGPSR